MISCASSPTTQPAQPVKKYGQVVKQQEIEHSGNWYSVEIVCRYWEGIWNLLLLPSSGPAPAQLAWLSLILSLPMIGCSASSRNSSFSQHSGYGFQPNFVHKTFRQVSMHIFINSQTKPNLDIFLGPKCSKTPPIQFLTFDFCQAQAQLQLSWPGLALFSAYL